MSTLIITETAFSLEKKTLAKRNGNKFVISTEGK
jgi:hypothetical protein